MVKIRYDVMLSPELVNQVKKKINKNLTFSQFLNNLLMTWLSQNFDLEEKRKMMENISPEDLRRILPKRLLEESERIFSDDKLRAEEIKRQEASIKADEERTKHITKMMKGKK